MPRETIQVTATASKGEFLCDNCKKPMKRKYFFGLFGERKCINIKCEDGLKEAIKRGTYRVMITKLGNEPLIIQT